MTYDYCLKFYEDGQKFRADLITPFGVDRPQDPQEIVNKYHETKFYVQHEPGTLVVRKVKTPYFITGVEVVQKTQENEAEFTVLNELYGMNLLEIWKVSFVNHKVLPPNEETVLEERVDYTNFFLPVRYENLNLEELITFHATHGWKRSEVINSITNLLKVKEHEVKSYEWENIVWLREEMNKHPELLAA
ncbi:hypothetical protein G7B40_024790 [Aetokthonos hydrillicola Thurmond2011]|jgi:hypothetical protein|uniref:Uncharacterized protein n=1 Tax=Aetokthonos hydrillicola Thurmond2011 TaxID=2712845 RepID=A0AAP5ICL0_9CYAN|nr:hypothetical protein [Aetokthonos hydrillicola]MBO3461546.1 hypothetical protein [Aetokthonos hydrillicola CCALA 1050]MBW4586152.1 hypothetical protein [Aetokthonos hydrillicola CCALA 1050]MDR9897759.1 hypothetical protein [Aetokthonos hydrillicola Thurmond2011]